MDRSKEILRIQLFGGLRLHYGGRRWRGFTTRKSAALFAYLVVHAGQVVERTTLAGLLWPGKGEDQARQSLRQALHAVAATLPRSRKHSPWLVTLGDRVGLNPGAKTWSDVGTFRRLLADGEGVAEGIGTHFLGRAVHLYQGELLAGLEVADSPEFELWLVSEQERCRTLAVDALCRLGETYLARGEHRLGLDYVRRLVELDPFNEEGHRLMMALLAVAGNRAAAIAHYRTLAGVLARELGVLPSTKTEELHQRIAGQGEGSPQPDSGFAPRPYVPLIGRAAALEDLGQRWQSVAAGRGRLTVVEGTAGVGKTRFIRSFLDGLAAREAVRLVIAETPQRRIHTPWAPFDHVVERLLEEERSQGYDPLAGLSRPDIRALASFATGFGLPPSDDSPSGSVMGLARFAHAVAVLIRAVMALHGDRHQGMVIVLDDLHRAPDCGLSLLQEVTGLLVREPVWFLAGCDRETVHRRSRLRSAFEAMRSVTEVEFLPLEPLEVGVLAALATEILAEGSPGDVAEQLMGASSGLPLGVVLQINHWWDEGRLVPSSGSLGCWQLIEPSKGLAGSPPGPPELAGRRIEHLSPFLRRVLTLAATLGSEFDADLLARMELETPDLVAAALERLLERWILLPGTRDWSSGRRQPPSVLRTLGAGRPRYEFDHELIRQAVLARVGRDRRRSLHARVAEVLAPLAPSVPDEVVAHHLVEAGSYRQALEAVQRALARRRSGGVTPECLRELRRMERVLSRACRRAGI